MQHLEFRSTNDFSAEQLESLNNIFSTEHGTNISMSMFNSSSNMFTCTHAEYGLIGGGILKYSPEYHSYVLSHCVFHLPDNHSAQDDEEEFDRICTMFYQGFFDTVELYCNTKSIKNLLVSCFGNEIEDMLFFGGWPIQNIVTCNENIYTAGTMVLSSDTCYQ